MKPRTAIFYSVLLIAGALIGMASFDGNQPLEEAPALASSSANSPAPEALDRPPSYERQDLESQGVDLEPSNHNESQSSNPSEFYHHPTRPYGVAGLALFKSIAEQSKRQYPQASIDKIREATDANEETASRLMNYIAAAVEDNAAHIKQLTRETCSQRYQLKSVADLARELDRTRVAAESRRVELVRGAQSILTADEMRRLDTYLHHSSERSSFVETDYERALATTGLSVEELLAKYCKDSK